ncbi:hypothetical protein HMPREF1092_00930 [Clostridium thermobutyricum]|uniref:Uncharacterized protein n=1 Tax=Clostridium thermobutyricum TaxID=29372 RepID=N9WF87_9CLOT|nr:hypothetical protein [Clostridium thermobutyricum]ENZ01696.1 hypothetical protein HMPREF1092_00930 [Clostridium thermobutyricum]
MEDIKTTNVENKPIEKIEKTYSFYNLLVFDKELNIVNLINFSNRNLKDNIYDDNSFYIEISVELFGKIRKLLDSNKLKLTKNPIQEQITIQDVQATPLPPQPPTKEELVNKALLEQTIQITELNQKTDGLAQGIMEGVIKQSKTDKKINALSKAILELTMKGSL